MINIDGPREKFMTDAARLEKMEDILVATLLAGEDIDARLRTENRLASQTLDAYKAVLSSKNEAAKS